MSTSKLGKNQWAELSPQKKNPFELPRLITRQLKQCAESHAIGRVAPVDNIKYLWINFGALGVTDEGAAFQKRLLSADEWKNVVDEAASLGVQMMVAFVSDPVGRGEEVWDVCQWAQNGHQMSVALYVPDNLELGLLQGMSRLDPGRTCLLVPRSRYEEAQPFSDSGIKVCVADVEPEERQVPCSGPRNMVYVGDDGRLFPCGLVHGNEQYLLGDVLEDPLAPMRRNDSLPWSVGEESGRNRCDACPNMMDKRMSGPSE